MNGPETGVGLSGVDCWLKVGDTIGVWNPEIPLLQLESPLSGESYETAQELVFGCKRASIVDQPWVGVGSRMTFVTGLCTFEITVLKRCLEI